jgi:hypothetical protein
MIYLMQSVPHVHLEYAHIQRLQENLQALIVVVGTSFRVPEAWQVLHCRNNFAKVLLIDSHRPEIKFGDTRPGIAPSSFQ